MPDKIFALCFNESLLDFLFVGILSLCAKGGRFNHFKAELMQIISVKIQKNCMQELDSTILRQC